MEIGGGNQELFQFSDADGDDFGMICWNFNGSKDLNNVDDYIEFE